MPLLERVEMVAPDGGFCAIMVRDRKKFEKQGYVLAGEEPAPVEGEEPQESGAEEAVAEAEAPALAVESRAFEQPNRKPPVKRRRRRSR